MKFLIFALSLIAPASLVRGAISLDYTFGVKFDSAGDALPDGTLWALVVDGGDDLFAGFGLDESLHAADQLVNGIADTYFTSGQSISLGSNVGGGTVFAMGGVNGGDGSSAGLLAGLTLGSNGLVAGRNFAIYWFPDATFSGNQNNPQTIADQVGGVQNDTFDVGVFFDTGMVIPSDGNDVIVGAANSTLGGSMADTDFRAVTLVPEPSSALLGAFGALALLRRRRVVQG